MDRRFFLNVFSFHFLINRFGEGFIQSAWQLFGKKLKVECSNENREEEKIGKNKRKGEFEANFLISFRFFCLKII